MFTAQRVALPVFHVAHSGLKERDRCATEANICRSRAGESCARWHPRARIKAPLEERRGRRGELELAEVLCGRDAARVPKVGS